MKELQQSKTKIKNDQSLMHLQAQENLQLPEGTDILLTKKPITKLDTNKHFSCIYIFGDTLYLGTRSSKLYIYKLYPDKTMNNQFTLEEEKIVTPHCQIVSHVVANQTYFITVPESDEESMISVWQTNNKMLTTALKGHKSQISKVAFMSNNKYLASASWDCTARIWALDNLNRDEPLKIYTGTYPILQLKEMNEQIIIFGGDDCYLVFWNWKKQEVIRKQFGHAGSVTYIQVLLPIIFTAGGDNKFKLWEVTQNFKTQEKINQNPMSIFLPKYNFKKIQEQKKQYDSIIFGTKNGNELFLMDRQGEIFVYHNNKSITQLKNQFQYNENVTGIDSYHENLLITTTKGCLKYFNITQQKNKSKKQIDQIIQQKYELMERTKKTEDINKSSQKKETEQSSETNLINIKKAKN